MKRALTTLVIAFIPALALADPDQLTSYLMNESASLFDLGLFRINAALTADTGQKTGKGEAMFMGIATYDYSSNEIAITAGVHTVHLKDADIKQTCLDSINELRRVAGGMADTAKLINTHSLFAPFFIHSGYHLKSAPSDDDVMSHIDGMINFTVYVRHIIEKPTFQDQLLMKCKVELLSNEVFYSTQE